MKAEEINEEVRLFKEYMLRELEKCKENPYYFATKYLTINGKPYTTVLTEEEFNNYTNNLKSK